MHHRIFIIKLTIAVAFLFGSSGQAFAAASSASSSASGSNSANNGGLQPLDGVNIEAVETYRNPKSNQIDFGLGMLPLDPYYNGFAIDLAYNHYFGKTFSWQVADVDYIYTVDTALRSELAERYNLQPTPIERLSLVATSNFEWVHAYGKFVFFKEHIRYFRSAFLIGPAYVVSNMRSTIGFNVGWRFETFVNDDFSWVLQIRDFYVTSNVDNNLAFVLGTAYAF